MSNFLEACWNDLQPGQYLVAGILESYKNTPIIAMKYLNVGYCCLLFFVIVI
jgi:hypothetical protein